MNQFFTSESVTCGHPDKVCDQIADRILDEMLRQDPWTRSACEVTCATDQVHIFGEVTTAARIDYEAVARKVIAEIGYTAREEDLTRKAVVLPLTCTSSPRILPWASPAGGKRRN